MIILHPTDLSEGAGAAQAEAVRLARALGAEVVLLFVVVEAVLYGEGVIGKDEVRRIYEAVRSRAAEALEARVEAVRRGGVPARARVEVGVPYREIVRVADEEGADFVVMGTHGRGALGRALVGSVAARVVREARCPVVTVRAPEPGAPAASG